VTIRNHKWKFTETLVTDAPDTRGVYALWRNEVLICVGRADGGQHTIRSRLRAHLSGIAGEESRHATHYSWEICQDPVERETTLLQELSSASAEAEIRNAPEVMEFREQKRRA
jgi:hypothetical protein